MKIWIWTLVVASIAACSSVDATEHEMPSDCRDAERWPFSQTSIWNMPIGSGAEYVAAGITAAQARGMTVDEDVLILTPDAPTRPVFRTTAGWSTGDRCGLRTSEVILQDAPVPLDFSTDPGYLGRTPNQSAAILLADGVSIWQSQPLHVCGENGYVVSQYVWPQRTYHLREDDGIEGAHGGSGLSSIGGTIRLGELVPGGTIRHALKVNLYAQKNLYYAQDEPDGKPGYRWPAIRADGYAAQAYLGTNPGLQMGSLLALHPEFDLGDLRTEPGKIIAQALVDYGAYVVDDTAWDVYAIATEWSPEGRVIDEFRSAWHFPMETALPGTCQSESLECHWAQDMLAIFTSLNVVANSSPQRVGGGGEPRQPLAPQFCD